MAKVPATIYQTAAELEARIKQRESEAQQLRPRSPRRRFIMKEIAQLRMYAEAKRWIESPGVRQPGK